MGRAKRKGQRPTSAQKTSRKKGRWERFHDEHYRALLFIPFLLAVLSILSMGALYVQTGDFIHRGISLRGGTSFTFTTTEQVSIKEFESELSRQIPGEEFTVRQLEAGGDITGVIVETSLRGQDSGQVVDFVERKLGTQFNPGEYTVEEIGGTLGETFFADLLKTLAFAFFLMGIVVFYYFRTIVPSCAVIFAALFDILITVGIVNMLGMRLSSAGIAAFLMLLGYSIDTDILLTSRILKRQKGNSIFEAMVDAMKTGLTMSAAGLSATTVAYIVSESAVIKQIMLILMIGLAVDVMTTWVQNAGLLRWYLEHKENKGGKRK